MSNTTLRILTALVGAPLVLGVTYLGGWPFVVLMLVAALASQHELYRLMVLGGLHPQQAAGLAIGGALVLRPVWPAALPLATVLALLLVAVNPFFTRAKQPLVDLSATVFGAIYPAAFLAFLVDLRLARGLELENLEGFYLTLGTLLLIWATDTFAYVAGRSLGKHPLAPSVSPKKTWEGSVGGALGALAVAVVLKLTLLDFLAWPHVVVLALICGIVSQLGDLAESKLKRSVGAKDSGTILPGHGGVLDRLDALILAAPLVYLYLAYLAPLLAG